MSLHKQIWLAVVCLMALTFGATFLVTTSSARDYLEHQLFMKNVDNASAFALLLARRAGDPEQQESTLAGHFSSGNYQLIELRDAEGKILGRWQNNRGTTSAPRWFTRLLAIDVEPGVAQLQAGGQILTVRSQVSFAYESLWHSARWLAAVFLAAAVIACALGSLALKMILKPLAGVVTQARAIGERRFVTMDEPSAEELRFVAKSMNELSARVKSMLQHESQRLEKWRQDAHVDEVTGVLNRDHFINLLASTLASDDANASGVITMIRVSGLASLNQVHGRDAVDSILAGFGQALSNMRLHNKAVAAGRLNGADFVLITPRELDPSMVGRDLQQALREVLNERGLMDDVQLPGASTLYIQGDSPTDLLTNLDSALLNAEQQGESEMVIMGRDGIQMMPVRQELKRWRSMLHNAFSDRKFSLATFPVTRLNGELLHTEAPVRLKWRDSTLTAGQFLPWIHRLELASELDRQVIELALESIRRQPRPIAVNLSGAALSDPGFLPWLSQMLSVQEDTADQLWLEVQEATAYRHLENFKRLGARCKRYGTRIGIEHLGHQLSEIGRLHDVGVDYVKVDSAFVRGIDSNPANQTLLRTLCTLAHSLGITVIAEGVSTQGEWSALADLGFDAATGPQVTARHAEHQPLQPAAAAAYS